MATRLEVRANVISCRNCDLCSGASHPVPFSGAGDSNIVVVGEAPGASEDREGKPFVGPAGKLLRSWLGNLGLDDPKPAFVNVVSCFPHRTPRKLEVEACRGNLWDQLSFIKPKWLLLVGAVAVSSWWPGIGLEGVRGKFWQAYWTNDRVIEQEVGDGWGWAFATYHPAAVLRNQSLAGEVMKDLRLFKEVVEGKVDPGLVYNDECTVCPAPVDVTRWGLGFCYEHDPSRRRGVPNHTRKVGVVPAFYDPGPFFGGKLVKTVDVQGRLL